MQSWQIQEAETRFGELLRDVANDGPQAIVAQGQLTAIVMSAADYERLKQRKDSLVELMRHSPLVGLELDLERDKSLPRPIDL